MSGLHVTYKWLHHKENITTLMFYVYLWEVHVLSMKTSYNGLCKKSLFCLFNIKLGDKDKSGTTHFMCKICTEHLRQWTNGQRKSMKFGILMVQHEKIDDCYICLVNITATNGKNRSKRKYSDLAFVRCSIAHSEEIPCPTYSSLPEPCEVTHESTGETEGCDWQHDGDYEGPSTSKGFSQIELNNLISEQEMDKN